MTTQDRQPETVDPTERVGSPTETSDSTTMSGSPNETTGSSVEGSDPSSRGTDASTTRMEASTQQTDLSADESLFAQGDLSGLRSRWNDIQSGFVDDPRECVQKADSLVSDVVDHLTAGFSAARTRLEEQWARGEEVSTEDLRLALKRYRAFFERLLAV
jgi:hypothetical protein